MSKVAWNYIEKDGNPEKQGYYLVACDAYVSYSYDVVDQANGIVMAHGEPFRCISYWDGKKWSHSQYDSFNIDDDNECKLRDTDHIYAWANIEETPKMIYPSRKVEIDPANYHLTESQLMNFLNDYKRVLRGSIWHERMSAPV